MITPSFGLTATERVLPRMALDFTTASLDPRVTFTRTGNTATVVNSSGLVASINADLPRFDFNLNTGGACKGLLIEEARTNIAPYSKEPANWFKAGTATVSGTGETSPDGTSNAFAISACEGNANRFSASGSLNVAGGSTVTFSVYLKANGNGTGAVLKIATAGGTYKEATSAVTITSSWERYSFTMTTNADNTGVFWIVYGNTGTTALVPWGVQVEVGAFATSFIPTVGLTTVTRTADVATMTGTNFSSWYNDSIGTFVTALASMQVKGTTDSVIFELFNNSAKNNRRGNFINAATGNLVWRSANNAGTIVDVNVAAAATANASKTACAWSNSATFIAESVNASAAATSSSASTPTSIDTLNIGRSRNDGAFFNQTISKLFFYPQTLINAELQAFSK